VAIKVISMSRPIVAATAATIATVSPGDREPLGGRDYGEAGVKERLSSLLSYSEVHLMAATCLPRPGTLEALSRGLRFLGPENEDTIAGWRERPTPETLANVPSVDSRTASVLY
jgi:hypothetical protein